MLYACPKCGYHTTDKSNFNRHCRRKTGCGASAHDNIHAVDHDAMNASGGMTNLTNVVHIGDIEMDPVTLKGTCPRCEREISQKHAKKHVEICKGVPKNTCCVCFKTFKTQPSHSRHQKMCKERAAQPKKKQHVPEPTTPPAGPSLVIHQHVTHNHVTINNHHTVHNNINVQFGNEQMEALVERIQLYNDERLRAIQNELRENYERRLRMVRSDYANDRATMQEFLQRQNTHMSMLTDLYFFNRDYPQNQTVRKTNKKSNVIEFRDGDQWIPEPSRTGVPRLVNSLSKYTRDIFDVNLQDFSGWSLSSAQDILYYKTKRGDVPDDQILKEYNPPPLDMDPRQKEAFYQRMYEDFDPSLCPEADQEHMASTRVQILDQIKYTARELGFQNFSIVRDGLPVYEKILQRFPIKNPLSLSEPNNFVS